MSRKIEVIFDIKAQAGQMEKVLSSLTGKINKMGANVNPQVFGRLKDALFDAQENLEQLQRIGEDGILREDEVKRATKAMDGFERACSTVRKELIKIPGLDVDKIMPKNFASSIGKASKAAEEYRKNIKDLAEAEEKLADAEATIKKGDPSKGANGKNKDARSQGQNNTLRSLENKIEKGTATEAEIEKANNIKNTTYLIKDLKAYDTAVRNREALINRVRELQAKTQDGFQKLVSQFSVDIPDLAKAGNIDEFEAILEKLPIEKAEEVRKAIDDIASEASNIDGPVNEMGEALDRSTNSMENMINKGKNIDHLKNQILAFFSISNAANLFRRAMDTAIQSIADLDKAMTDTAVVTDYTVSDMWDQLDQYTQIANELGATTVGAYETMTLYFQQGLNADQAMQLGTETMKMARIAGMDYAETTDAMTAALRGFNLELNETSAKRVNDVYSELAAITAADTQEIATAMSKTASLAESVGLDIETTATYLAEAIETTREAPENIGTAMKTIIARYAGLTKDPAELTEEMQEALDGESVDANRTTAALSSAGISALDTAGNFRNLGDVFLELNEKWDSLDMMQQRYIATQFAGTRQQSRFIAMMQNYGRTQELLNGAYDSEGASQKQFDKTLDSYESKMNQLKNAWNNFTMGILNADLLKSGISILTTIIGVFDKLTSGIDDVTGGLMKIGLLIGTWKLGANVFNSFTAALGQVGKEGAVAFTQSFKDNLKSNFGGGLKGIKESLFGHVVEGKETRLLDVDEIFDEIGDLQVNFDGLDDLDDIMEAAQETSEQINDTLHQTTTVTSQVGRTGFFPNIGNYAKVLFRNQEVAAEGFKNLEKAGMASSNGILSSIAKMSGGTKAGLGLVGAALTAVGIIWAVHRRNVEEACERAQKAISNYTESTQEIAQNRETLESVGDEFATLAEGIGKNGENISLSAEQYSRYNEIVKQLVEINPSIVQGYNAQGEAIINTTTALRELNDEQDKAEQIALKKYTSDQNFKDTQTDIDAANKKTIKNSKLNLDKYYEAIGAEYSRGPGRLAVNVSNVEAVAENATKYRKEAQKTFDETTKGLEVDSKEYEKAEEDLQKRLDLIDQFESANEELETNSQEFINLLSAYAQREDVGFKDGESLFDSVPARFQALFTEGIKEIGKTETDPVQAKKDVKNLAKEYKKMTPEVVEAMEVMEEAKEKFLDSDRDTKAIEDYNNAINENVAIIQKTANEYIDQEDAIGTAIGNSLNSAANSFKDFADTAEYSLEQAINPFEDLLQAAKTTKEAIDELAESNDYYTASNNYNEITDTILGEQNVAGRGSRTFWSGAEAILSDKKLKEYDSRDREDRIKAQKDIEKYQSYINPENPEAGARKFYDALMKKAESGKGYIEKAENGGFYIDPKNMEKAASQFGLSEEAFVAAISELSQYLDDFTWNTPEAVESALTQDENVFKSQYDKGGYLVDKKYFENAVRSQGGDIEAVQKQVELKDGQVVDFEEGTKKQLKNAFKGIKDLNTGDNIDLKKVLVAMLDMGISNDGIENTLKQLASAENGVINGEEFVEDGKVDWSAVSEFTEAYEAVDEPITNLQNAVIDKMDLILAQMGHGNTLSTQEERTEWFNNALKGLRQKELSDDDAQGIINNKQQITTRIDELERLKESGELKDEQKKELKNLKEYNKYIESVMKDSEGWQAYWANTHIENGNFDKFEERYDNNNTILDKANPFYDDIIEKRSDWNDAGFNGDKISQNIISGEYGDEENTQRVIDIYTNIADNNLDSYEFKLDQLDPEVKTKLITETPGIQVLSDYAAEINKITNESDRELVINTAMTGDFTTDEWKEFTEREPVISAKIETETKALSGEEDFTITATNIELDKNATKGVSEGVADALNKAAKVNNLEISNTALESVKKKIRESIGATKPKVHVTASMDAKNITLSGGGKSVTATLKMSNAATGKNLAGSAAKGAARGRIGPRGNGGATLTGEVGPELVWEPSKGISYITGANGPEMRNLPGNAVVWPADQTKRIMSTMSSAAGGKNLSGSAVGGVWDTSGGGDYAKKAKTLSTSGTKDSSTTKKQTKNSKWENPFDRLYNLEKKINKELRIREKLNGQYERMLKDLNTTTSDVSNNLSAQVDVLKSTISDSSKYLDKRRKELNTKLKQGKSKGLNKYVTYDKETDMVQIDWNKINKVKKSKKGEKIKNYAEDLEKIQDSIESQEDQIEKAQEALQEIYGTIKDKYINLLNQIYSDLVEKRQKEIDKLSNINDAIDEANQKLLDSINKNVERIRQNQDNAEAEQNLTDLYTQLAILQRDGSLGNQSAIKDLEKQIAEAEKEYKNTLEDQAIAKLEEENSKASEARSEQLEALQGMLDWDEENGTFWDEVNQLIADAGESLDPSDELWILIAETEGLGKTMLEIQQIMTETNDLLTSGYGQRDKIASKGQKVQPGSKLYDENGNLVDANVAGMEFEADGTLTVNGRRYTGITTGADAQLRASGSKSIEEIYNEEIANRDKKGTINASQLKNLFSLGKQLGKDNFQVAKELAKTKGITWKEILKAAKSAGYGGKKVKQWNPKAKSDSSFRKAFVNVYGKWNKFAEGGLADYTGPAWLDGTPSKPEMVLNAKDTANFIQLKDALQGFNKLDTNNNVTESNMNFEININVDKIDSDYDVDALTNRIKQNIVKDMRYRNVNSINRLR